MSASNHDTIKEKDIKLSQKKKEQEKAFSDALKEGDTDKLWELIENGVNVNIQDKDGNTFLMYAASRNFKTTIKRLVQNGANINLKNKNGETAIDLVLKESNKDIRFTPEEDTIRTLVEQGASMTINQLIIAIQKKLDSSIMEEQINKADISELNQSDINNLFFRAVKNQNRYMISKLLQNGVDVNLKDEDGNTPLINAIIEEPSIDSEGITRILLQNGADIKLKNKNNETAFDIALKDLDSYSAGSEIESEVIQILAEYGAPIKTKQLNIIISKGSDSLGEKVVDCMELSEIDKLDKESDMTPLMMAAKYMNTNTVRKLIEKGVNTNKKNKAKQTALDYLKESEEYLEGYSEESDIYHMIRTGITDNAPMTHVHISPYASDDDEENASDDEENASDDEYATQQTPTIVTSNKGLQSLRGLSAGRDYTD